MGEYVNPAKIFGENVFNDTVMQERLPKNVYKKLKKIIEEGGELHLLSRPVDCVLPLRQEDIQHGTAPHRLSFVRTQQAQHSAFRLHSAPTQERRLTRKHRFFVPWKL